VTPTARACQWLLEKMLAPMRAPVMPIRQWTGRGNDPPNATGNEVRSRDRRTACGKTEAREARQTHQIPRPHRVECPCASNRPATWVRTDIVVADHNRRPGLSVF
jgi:hypothetical protein